MITRRVCFATAAALVLVAACSDDSESPGTVPSSTRDTRERPALMQLELTVDGPEGARACVRTDLGRDGAGAQSTTRELPYLRIVDPPTTGHELVLLAVPGDCPASGETPASSPGPSNGSEPDRLRCRIERQDGTIVTEAVGSNVECSYEGGRLGTAVLSAGRDQG